LHIHWLGKNRDRKVEFNTALFITSILNEIHEIRREEKHSVCMCMSVYLPWSYGKLKASQRVQSLP
jgi:hypothetical protein